MSVVYHLVPREVLQGLLERKANPPAPPRPEKNLDEQLLDTAKANMMKIAKAKSIRPYVKNAQYQAQVRDYRRQKKAIENRPVRVQITNPTQPNAPPVQGTMTLGPPDKKPRRALIGDERRPEDMVAVNVATPKVSSNALGVTRKRLAARPVRRKVKRQKPTNDDLDTAEEVEEEEEEEEENQEDENTPQANQTPVRRAPQQQADDQPRVQATPPQRQGQNESPRGRLGGIAQIHRHMQPAVWDAFKRTQTQRLYEYVKKNRGKFGITTTDQILDKHGNVLKSSELKKILPHILSMCINEPLPAKVPTGTRQLAEYFNEDRDTPAFVETIKEEYNRQFAVASPNNQHGGGKRGRPKEKSDFRAQRWVIRPRR